MAAHLKKRVYEEFSKVVQVSNRKCLLHLHLKLRIKTV